MLNPVQIAEKFKTECRRLGWRWSTDSSILTISKHFTPGSNEEFVDCDSQYHHILAIIPRTSPGSIWGTDSGGIGALSAIRSGTFVEHKSGCSKRILNLLKKES